MRIRTLIVSSLTVLLLFCSLLYGQQQETPPDVREHDWILLKGTSKWLVGTIVKETDKFYLVKLRDYASETEMPIPKERVAEVRRRQSLEEALEARLERAEKTPEALIAVARWTLGYPQLFRRTVEILVRTVKMRPDFPEPYLMLLNLIRQDCAEKGREMTEKEKDTILDALEAALPLKHPLLTASYASMLADAGLPQAGFELLKEFQTSVPEDSPPSYKRAVEITLAEIAFKMGKFETARTVLEKLLEREPDSYRALLLLAKVAFESGRLDGTSSIIERLKTFEPPYWEVYALEGALAFTKGSLAEAENHFSTAGGLRKPTPQMLLDLAEVQLLRGKVHTAREHLQALSAGGCSLWRLFYLNALASQLLGEEDAVGDWLRKAAEADDAPPFTYYQLASFLLMRGRVIEAREWVKKALDAGFDAVRGFRLLARIEAEGGDDAAAERALLYALAASPEDVHTLYMLAEMALRKGDHKDALSYLSQATTLAPDHLPSLKLLAYLNYSQNRFDVARRYFERAFALAPDAPYIQRLKKALDEVETLLCWRDVFRRADSTEVANGWTEVEVTKEGAPLGVEVKLERSRLVMEGRQEQNGDALLMRAEKVRNFVRFEAMLDFGGAEGVNSGLKVLARDTKGNIRAWLAFWRDTTGRLRYDYSDTGSLQGELKGKTDCGICLGRARLAVELADVKEGLWRFYLDGELVGEVKTKGVIKHGGAEIFVALFGRAPPPKEWRLSCEYVHIFRRKK